VGQENLLCAWGLWSAYRLSTYYIGALNTILIETDAKMVMANLKQTPYGFRNYAAM